MSETNPYAGIYTEGPEPRQSPFDPPARVLATKKMMRVIRDAREENPSEEHFADWLVNYMEGYAAVFAHPVFDVSEGASGDGPECSLCGVMWPMCGHDHMSHWEPVKRTHPTTTTQEA